MKKVRRFKVSNDVFKHDTLVVCGGSRNDAIDYFCKRTGVDLSEFKESREGTSFTSDRSAFACIWFADVKPSVGTIAHESLHVVLNAMRVIGMEMCSGSEEAFCYSLGHLSGSIFKKTR